MNGKKIRLNGFNLFLRIKKFFFLRLKFNIFLDNGNLNLKELRGITVLKEY
jgi:hypothetical protein